MLKRNIVKSLLATSLFLYSGATYAGFPGDFLQKLGDATSDILSFGENGRIRDRERANADARYFEMQAQMQRMQMNQQVQYLKNQIQIVFGFYCDDISKLEKVHNLQSETFRTIAAFKGALTFAKKIENNTANFQKINANVKAQLDRISLQFNDAFDADSGKSIFTLNEAIRDIVTLAQQSQDDTNMYVAYIMKNIADNKESLVSNLSMMNLLLTNIHHLLKSLELDISNQILRSSHLNQTGLKQLFILDTKQTPLLDLFSEKGSCTFRFREHHEPYQSGVPGSLESIADLIRSNSATRLVPVQEMVRNNAERFGEVLSQFTVFAEKLERANILPQLSKSDLSKISQLSPQGLKELWVTKQIKDLQRWDPNFDSRVQSQISPMADRNPLLNASAFNDILSKLAQALQFNFSSPEANHKFEVISYITLTMDYAEANKIKKETLLAAIIQSTPMPQSDTLSEIYRYSKEQVRIHSKLMTQARLSAEMLASQYNSGYMTSPRSMNSNPYLNSPPPSPPGPGPTPIPPPRTYGR